MAAELEKPVAVFDLETTTFLEEATFGVTEACVLKIPETGKAMMWAGLVNPEHPIAQAAQTKTGITDTMVRGKPTFARWAPTFGKIATQAVAVGYNSRRFDIPGIERQAKRYGAIIKFGDSIDVYDAYLRLMVNRDNGRKGNLGDVAARFGIVPKGGLHRAAADVMTTALLAEAILKHYGLHGLTGKGPLGEILTKIAVNPAERKARIAESIARDGYDKVRIAEALGMSESDVATAAWECHADGTVAVEAIIEERIQRWLRPRIRETAETCWRAAGGKRLKPIMEALQAIPHGPELDYTQIRVALKLEAVA